MANPSLLLLVVMATAVLGEQPGGNKISFAQVTLVAEVETLQVKWVHMGDPVVNYELLLVAFCLKFWQPQL